MFIELWKNKPKKVIEYVAIANNNTYYMRLIHIIFLYYFVIPF